MGHFPYVHTGILGEEPRTEVVDYRAVVEDACECVEVRLAANAQLELDLAPLALRGQRQDVVLGQVHEPRAYRVGAGSAIGRRPDTASHCFTSR